MKDRLGDPALRRDVEAAVRRRIHGDEAEDVVQATLADLLSAPQLPDDPEEFRRFVFGVARNKVFDHFRRQKRQTSDFDDEETAGPEQPLSARDILRWAEGELPDSESKNTLEWMLREGDGEKLEHIARDARVPAPRVRKRVSRLRKLLRDRWQAELLLAGLLALLAAFGGLYWYLKHVDPEDLVKPEPRVLPSAPRDLPPGRPAGDSAPQTGPAPAPAPSFAPAPSASAAPAPSGAKTLAPKAKAPLKAFNAKASATSEVSVSSESGKPAAPPAKQKSKAAVDSNLFDSGSAK